MLFEKIDGQWIGHFDGLRNDSRVIHAFSARMGGVSESPYDSLNLGLNTDDNPDHVQINRERFLNRIHLSSQQLVIPRQIHGNHTVVVHTPGEFLNADAVLTAVSGIALSVQVADCLPIFLYDSNRVCIGLVHAGWRGTLNGISSQTVRTMAAEFQSNPSDIWAFVGPSIGPLCYEVGESVKSQFNPAYVCGNRVNLWQCNQDQLIHAGIPEHQIQVSSICTHCNSMLFFSHRASGGKTGRMMAVMMIKK